MLAAKDGKKPGIADKKQSKINVQTESADKNKTSKVSKFAGSRPSLPGVSSAAAELADKSVAADYNTARVATKPKGVESKIG